MCIYIYIYIYIQRIHHQVCYIIINISKRLPNRLRLIGSRACWHWSASRDRRTARRHSPRGGQLQASYFRYLGCTSRRIVTSDSDWDCSRYESGASRTTADSSSSTAPDYRNRRCRRDLSLTLWRQSRLKDMLSSTPRQLNIKSSCRQCRPIRSE